MNTLVENLTGMSAMTDQVIAYDFLLAAKSGVKTIAGALAETATPEVRTVLKKQLDEAIATHEQITNFMVSKGWYQAYNVQEQINLDLAAGQTALKLIQG